MIEETIKQWRQSRFEYGQTDCLLSVGAYLVAQGGRDVLDQFRGTYDTQEQALALMAAHGGPQGLLDLSGFPRIDPAEVSRGDAVVVRLNDGDGIGGICTGPGVVVRGERSVIELPLKRIDVIFAWKVC